MRDRHKLNTRTHTPTNVHARSHASALISSLGVYIPGRIEPSLCSPDCNAALQIMLVAYEDSVLVKLVYVVVL
jgi:hypothetical protein